METDAAGPPATTQQPVPPRIVLQPGQLSKPEKVWASSSTLVIGFYQTAPYSESFKIFYKKTGAVFGTQVLLTPASILGPELAVRQPVSGEAQYFEYEIKKLKPSTQYLIKIKTSDDTCEVRSDKMGTVSLEEERTRDNDMRNFVGALVKLGDYDGLVVSFTPNLGIFAIRILQIDDVSASLQLARLTSDYTDNGVPVQAYTLSQVKFGRWGGAITGSKVVNEGELKWLVARAVQMGDKSDAAAAFEARQRMLQAQVEKVTMSLEVEWSNRLNALRFRSLAYLLLLALFVMAAAIGLWAVLRRAGSQQRYLMEQLAVNGRRQADLESELQLLHLYRVSLELDVERRVALKHGAAAAGARHNNMTWTHNHGGAGLGCGLGPTPCGRGGLFMSNASRRAFARSMGWADVGGGGGGGGGSHGGGAADLGDEEGGGGAMLAGGPRSGLGGRARRSAGRTGSGDPSSGSGSGTSGGSGEKGGRGRGRGRSHPGPPHKEPTAAAAQRGKGAGGKGGQAAKGRKEESLAGGAAGARAARAEGMPLHRDSGGGGSRRVAAEAREGRRSSSRSGSGGSGSVRGRGGDAGKGAQRGGGAAGGIKSRAGASRIRFPLASPENDDDGGGGGGGRGRRGRPPGGEIGARDLWGFPQQLVASALAKSRSGSVGAALLPEEWVDEAGAFGSEATEAVAADDDDGEEQPDAWAFIHYVSHVYALYLHEWMKVQLQKGVREKVNEMLLTSPPPTAHPSSPDDDDDDGELDDDGDHNYHSPSCEYGEEGCGDREYDGFLGYY